MSTKIYVNNFFVHIEVHNMALSCKNAQMCKFNNRKHETAVNLIYSIV